MYAVLVDRGLIRNIASIRWNKVVSVSQGPVPLTATSIDVGTTTSKCKGLS